jgi:branched-chain amino acid transport system substrate-binding protein
VKLCHLIASTAAASAALAGASGVVSAAAGASTTPVKIAFVGVESGAYPIPDRNNDLELAVDDVNAAGGVDGHLLEYSTFDTGLTTEQAVTATQQAIAWDPTVIMGYSVDGQVQASASLLRQSGLPVLSVAQGPAALSTIVKVPNLYTVVADGPAMAEAATTTYGYRTYHPTTVGIFSTDDSASDAEARNAQRDLRVLGVRRFIVRSAPDTSTDTTAEARAMRGAGAVYEYGFPSVEAVFNRQLGQSGYTGPILGDQSGTTLVAFGLNTEAELAHYTFSPYCFPQVLASPAAEAYSAGYAAAYPTASPLVADPYIYDAVHLVAAAVARTGGSLSPSALVAAIGRLTYHGACGVYHADRQHGLLHQVELISLGHGFSDPELAGIYVEHPLTRIQLQILAGI